MQKIKTYRINAVIVCKTGTRVGGSNDLLQIGGVDLTCIKDPVTFQPYLPGSSLKGKMRSELEKEAGKFSGRDNSEPCGCALDNCLICRIFGPHKKTNHTLGPSRIIVRDALPLAPVTLENKTENINNRQTGAAQHPRTAERAASGSKFGLEVLVQEWDIDARCDYQGKVGGKALALYVVHGLKLLEETGIGAGVGKGYGKIKVESPHLIDAPHSALDELIAAL